MPKHTKTEQVQKMICDECGQEQEFRGKDKDAPWLEMKTVQADGLRLFQRNEEMKRYESFHIPNQVVEVFCSKECMIKHLTGAVEFFVAEIAPSRKLGKKRREIEIP